MSIFNQNNRWIVIPLIAGALIVVTTLTYTNYLTRQLAAGERNMVDIWVLALEELNEFDDEDWACMDPNLHLEVIRKNETVPIILYDKKEGITGVANFGENRESDTTYLMRQVDKMKDGGFEPIRGYYSEVYFKESNLLRQLRYFPILQILLIAVFLTFVFYAFAASRKEEQNRVWVGMAKETAHQLGTPITAIVAWIEHLKAIRAEDEEVVEVAEELQNDVERLNLVADRFSKIGSTPVLHPTNIYEELEKCREYMQRRAPRRVSFHFPPPDLKQLDVHINPHLFDWVVENLMRNALDAMEGKGEISAEVYEDPEYVYIDLSDTGKGMPASQYKRVFRPGFTTKKRGWGLGLSLAKRIIVEYHSGKIFVKKSVVGEGTTFTIALPREMKKEG
ncbi:MAG: HAMP domain-containing sensor histidine kinase [Bacteroidota bacterium]